MTGDLHPAAEIKSVRRKTLHAGVEMELFATGFASALHEPVKKRYAKSLSAIVLAGDQILDVKQLSPGKTLRNVITRHEMRDRTDIEQEG